MEKELLLLSQIPITDFGFCDHCNIMKPKDKLISITYTRPLPTLGTVSSPFILCEKCAAKYENK